MLTMSDEITTSEHRAAWDATISAPKSVSLAALVGGDGRIRDAHRESVNETLKEFEKYLQACGGGPPSRHDFCLNRSGYVKPLK
jgi:conjugative relaxase-like TrwC/TraI family protein